uniref:Tf2-1-like SH3-like domain-containing protein n=1 Tax=Nelumbo nucifera TaxID=4432 RepID=A0A822ZMX0_NELNU|nr:TPA_asm: hypothetical protein HUJ06_017291 [Nelumbo nucifera]
MQYDKKHRNGEHQVGDLAYLKLQPYRQSSLAKRAWQKFSPRFFGPFRISGRVEAVAYKLDFPSTARLHPVFHVSLLKPCRTDAALVKPLLPEFTSEGQLIVEPNVISDIRWIKIGRKVVKQALGQWTNLPTEDATWEDFSRLQEKFPHLDLEAKVILKGGGDDGTQVGNPPSGHQAHMGREAHAAAGAAHAKHCKPPLRFVYNRRPRLNHPHA